MRVAAALAIIAAVLGCSTSIPKEREAHYEAASTLDKSQEGKEAYRLYEKYVHQYPESKESDTALQRMYEIALGRADTSWGNEKLVQLLEKYPAAPLAAEAAFQIGRFHFTNRRFDEAIIALKSLVENYPESERAEAGIFLIGDSELGQYEGQDYESMPLLRAKMYYELITRTYPSGAYAAKAKNRLGQITEELAKRDYRMALYYRRHGKPASSEVYLKSILKEYPETEYAQRAQKLLAATKESEK